MRRALTNLKEAIRFTFKLRRILLALALLPWPNLSCSLNYFEFILAFPERDFYLPEYNVSDLKYYLM
jgi:hypothetical protein